MTVPPESADPGGRALPTQIKVERQEGLPEEIVAVLIAANDPDAKFCLWDHADLVLRTWASTAPERGCQRCYIRVSFDNGEHLVGMLDLRRDMADQGDPILATELWFDLAFAAGIWRPEFMSEADYESAQSGLATRRYGDAQRLLNTCFIPGPAEEAARLE